MWLYAFAAAWLGSAGAWPTAQTEDSGIVSYLFEPNPTQVKPKMYNWEVWLSKADSQLGSFEIIQLTRPTNTKSNVAAVVPQVLVDSKVLVTGPDGSVHFKLFIGDRTL